MCSIDPLRSRSQIMTGMSSLERRGAQAVLTIAYDLTPRTRLAAPNCDIISVDPECHRGSCLLCHRIAQHGTQRAGVWNGSHLAQTGEHRMLTGAGWSYRTNDRGWIIYRDPQTQRWHTLNGALSVMRSAMSIPALPKVAS